MANHYGIGADACASAEEVEAAYRRAMADGRIDADEHAGLLALTAANVTYAAEVALGLRAAMAALKCVAASKHRRSVEREWAGTSIVALYGDDQGPHDDGAALEAA